MRHLERQRMRSPMPWISRAFSPTFLRPKRREQPAPLGHLLVLLRSSGLIFGAVAMKSTSCTPETRRKEDRATLFKHPVNDTCVTGRWWRRFGRPQRDMGNGHVWGCTRPDGRRHRRPTPSILFASSRSSRRPLWPGGPFQDPSGELSTNFARLKGDVTRNIGPWRLEAEEHASVGRDGQAVFGDGRPEQIPAQPLELGRRFARTEVFA